MELGKVDFTHEREWRAKGDFHLKGIGFYVIVRNREEEKKIKEKISEEAKEHIIGYLQFDHLSDLL